jgi:hypothetical protein
MARYCNVIDSGGFIGGVKYVDEVWKLNNHTPSKHKEYIVANVWRVSSHSPWMYWEHAFHHHCLTCKSFSEVRLSSLITVPLKSSGGLEWGPRKAVSGCGHITVTRLKQMNTMNVSALVTSSLPRIAFPKVLRAKVSMSSLQIDLSNQRFVFFFDESAAVNFHILKVNC